MALAISRSIHGARYQAFFCAAAMSASRSAVECCKTQSGERMPNARRPSPRRCGASAAAREPSGTARAPCRECLRASGCLAIEPRAHTAPPPTARAGRTPASSPSHPRSVHPCDSSGQDLRQPGDIPVIISRVRLVSKTHSARTAALIDRDREAERLGPVSGLRCSGVGARDDESRTRDSRASCEAGHNDVSVRLFCERLERWERQKSLLAGRRSLVSSRVLCRCEGCNGVCAHSCGLSERGAGSADPEQIRLSPRRAAFSTSVAPRKGTFSPPHGLSADAVRQTSSRSCTCAS